MKYFSKKFFACAGCISLAVLIFIITAAPVIVTAQDESSHANLLAIGDVNLGRAVGQRILKGDIDYPFQNIAQLFKTADVVFANLESPISDQHGETQSPRSNIVFCAPPDAAKSLRNAHIAIVATANNHEYDYGMKGLSETIRYLTESGISFVGSTLDSNTYSHVILKANNISFGFLGYTQFVNIHHGWKGRIALFDSVRIAKEIQVLKPLVDVVIVSFHGGKEYADVPDSLTKNQLHWIAECGADIVLGHHPHVMQGIERYKNCWIIQSLGNAVFYQPQKYWTQWSFAVNGSFVKNKTTIMMTSLQIIPIQAGYQPTDKIAIQDAERIVTKLNTYSNITISHNEKGYFVENITPSTNR